MESAEWTSMSSIQLRLAAGIVALLGVVPVSAAQDARLPHRAMEPRVESPPVEPTVVGPDPDVDLVLRFHATLDATRDEGVREARLNIARRTAPFDLDWGLP